MIFDQIIGALMRLYRKSPFHSQKTGYLLAKILSFFLLFRGRKNIIKEIGGIKYEIDLREVIDSSLFYSGTFEEPEERIIDSICKPGMIAFDIGANIGYHTFKMASLVKPDGLVYAFEPTHWAFEKLIRNAKLNPAINNIKYFRLGLSEKDENNRQLAFRSSYRTDGKQVEKEEEISLVKLDTFMMNNGISNLDFIKMDVDGYECKVIRGALNSLREFQPFILFEICPALMITNGDRPADLAGDLDSIGYIFETEEKTTITDLVAYCAKIKKNSSAMILAIPSGKIQKK
jgi:FkbM family methyltransferase